MEPYNRKLLTQRVESSFARLDSENVAFQYSLDCLVVVSFMGFCSSLHSVLFIISFINICLDEKCVNVCVRNVAEQ